MPEGAAQTRMEALQELVEALRPQVLSQHSEHGLQGVSGLVGQYRQALAEIEALQPKEQVGDGIDEIAARRDSRRGSATKRPGSAEQSG